MYITPTCASFFDLFRSHYTIFEPHFPAVISANAVKASALCTQMRGGGNAILIKYATFLHLFSPFSHQKRHAAGNAPLLLPFLPKVDGIRLHLSRVLHAIIALRYPIAAPLSVFSVGRAKIEERTFPSDRKQTTRHVKSNKPSGNRTHRASGGDPTEPGLSALLPPLALWERGASTLSDLGCLRYRAGRDRSRCRPAPRARLLPPHRARLRDPLHALRDRRGPCIFRDFLKKNFTSRADYGIMKPCLGESRKTRNRK